MRRSAAAQLDRVLSSPTSTSARASRAGFFKALPLPAKKSRGPSHKLHVTAAGQGVLAKTLHVLKRGVAKRRRICMQIPVLIEGQLFLTCRAFRTEQWCVQKWHAREPLGQHSAGEISWKYFARSGRFSRQRLFRIEKTDAAGGPEHAAASQLSAAERQWQWGRAPFIKPKAASTRHRST